jgi:UDP-apiose/xylose synthase
MKLVIIGCGGFIGSHLLDQLLRDDSMFIRGWDPQTLKIQHHLTNPRLQLYRHEFNRVGLEETATDAVQWADVVINLAAICNPSRYTLNPLDVIRTNFIDTWPLVELCALERKWLIHFSTSEVYGRTLASYLPDNRYDEPNLYELDEYESPLIMGPISNQRWTYACAKQLTERFIYAHNHENGMPFTIVRPLNFLGPRMDFLPGRDGEGVPRVFACFMNALIEGNPLQLVDGGRSRRTIVSIHEAVQALLLILAKPEIAQGNIFNIGNRDNETTVAELATLMCECYAEITGNPQYRRHPIAKVDSAKFYGEGYEDCDRRMPKLDRALSLLGWAPRIPLRDVLMEAMTYTYEHYVTSSPPRLDQPEDAR